MTFHYFSLPIFQCDSWLGTQRDYCSLTIFRFFFPFFPFIILFTFFFPLIFFSYSQYILFYFDLVEDHNQPYFNQSFFKSDYLVLGIPLVPLPKGRDSSATSSGRSCAGSSMNTSFLMLKILIFLIWDHKSCLL